MNEPVVLSHRAQLLEQRAGLVNEPERPAEVERALRAYRRAGFLEVAEHEGERRFVEMERNAE